MRPVRPVTAACAQISGLAPGPYVVGLLSDMINLKTALAIAPMVSVVSAVLFVLASRYYERDVAAIGKGDKR